MARNEALEWGVLRTGRVGISGTPLPISSEIEQELAALLSADILLEKGNGMLTITEKNMAQFNELLTAYYNTNDMRAIKVFLYEHAISGIKFQKTEISEPDRDR